WWLLRPARMALPGRGDLGVDALSAGLALVLVPALALLLDPQASTARCSVAAFAVGGLVTAGSQLAPAAEFVPAHVNILLLLGLLLTAVPLRRAPHAAAPTGVDRAERPPSATPSTPQPTPPPMPPAAALDPERSNLDRSGFERCLQQASADGLAFVVLGIEVDLPALEGPNAARQSERLLDKTAQRLRQLLHPGDALARAGERQFLMLGVGIAEQGAVEDLALRVIKAVARPLRWSERELSLVATVGSVTGPGALDAQRLIGCTEQALRQARRLGQRHRPFAADDEDSADPALLQALREAIANDGLCLQYQPKVDTRSGRVAAVEALVRWEHPQRGRISPAEFVPLAERHGLIVALGDWVIEAACRQSRAWREGGLYMRVAVNVSTHQMQQSDLARKLQASLQRHGVAPQLLTCEITESAAMQDTEVAQQIFRELREIGVSISIDDFGTGYSSLAYLRKLPAEELKIDRAFVTDLAQSADARAVVLAVVQLAHALGLHVVAEGVETEEQRRLLTELGCDQLQGYLLARPMTGQGVALWARHDREHDNVFENALYDEAAATQGHGR
ncbi:MAG: EAL domain-containing protein, partial [Burkholderiales bacterium]|nr:EAL domain-containing protein [Burkholderiales bacterium]